MAALRGIRHMARFARRHWSASLVTLATLLVVLVVIAKWAGGPDPSKVQPRANPGERDTNIEAASTPPGAGIDKLPSRDFPSAKGEPFWAQSRAQIVRDKPRAAPQPTPPAQPPQAPPLPYTYLGRIRSGGATTVFLAGPQNRESVARVGDILDDVEAGRRAGCRTVMLDVGHETVWRRSPLRTPHLMAANLLDAARLITAAEHGGETAHEDRPASCHGGPLTPGAIERPRP